MAAEEGSRRRGKRAGRAAEQGAVEVLVEGRCRRARRAHRRDRLRRQGRAVHDHRRRASPELALEQGQQDLEKLQFEGATVGEHVAQMAAKLGENVALGRVVVFETTDGVLDGYKHVQNGRGTIGVLVEIAGADGRGEGTRSRARRRAAHRVRRTPLALARRRPRRRRREGARRARGAHPQRGQARERAREDRRAAASTASSRTTACSSRGS